jgi:integrase/recombinase XerC
MPRPKKDQLLERYLKYLHVERNASPRTVVAYRHALAKFMEFVADKVSWEGCTAQQFRG